MNIRLLILKRWKLVTLLVSNVLLLLLALYGVYGAFWVWQEGASPRPQWVPLFGSQSYLQSVINDPNMVKGYNYAIAYEFLTYHVEYWKGTSRIAGVTIFDWTQFSLLLLALLDVGVLVYFLVSRALKKSS